MFLQLFFVFKSIRKLYNDPDELYNYFGGEDE
ncbi:hypothetical protein SAMN05444484_105243 [Flavobacterium chilense]|uniref:Uncharacterized protein n=1 Tax=Flavobacterium chilense TaxID=946677 RepID=A0A1M7I3E7_9FLAO|nr:hypothetical protein SAMN05444484_105243 [Flavobacterium chilense]